jgi:hypothetical protein
MFFYCYVYIFSLLCMFYSVYSVFIVPTCTLRLPWLRFLRTFSSVVRQMSGYNSQRPGTARTLSKLIVLLYVLFLCKCVLYYCHRVSTQLKLTNISIYLNPGTHWVESWMSWSACLNTDVLETKFYVPFGNQRKFSVVFRTEHRV